MADDLAATAGAPDEYERRYMEGDRALARARQRMPRWVPLSALAVVAAAFWTVSPTLAWLWRHRDLPGAALALAVVGGWFAVNSAALILALLVDHITRVVVTSTHLRVHRGLWTDDIALASVTAVAVESARWWRPRHTLLGALSRRERSYLTPGSQRALRVEWRDAKGRARKLWVQFDDASMIAERVASQMPARGGVRIETVPDDDSAADDEALSDELATADAHGRARRR